MKKIRSAPPANDGLGAGVFSMKRKTRRPAELFLMLPITWCVIGLAGCGHEATLQHETSAGGLISFATQSPDDILSSPGRRDALRMIEQKCPAGYKIIKEGELPKVSRAADRAWGPQIGTDRIWGIQFTCK